MYYGLVFIPYICYFVKNPLWVSVVFILLICLVFVLSQFDCFVFFDVMVVRVGVSTDGSFVEGMNNKHKISLSFTLVHWCECSLVELLQCPVNLFFLQEI